MFRLGGHREDVPILFSYFPPRVNMNYVKLSRTVSMIFDETQSNSIPESCLTFVEELQYSTIF